IVRSGSERLMGTASIALTQPSPPGSPEAMAPVPSCRGEKVPLLAGIPPVTVRGLCRPQAYLSHIAICSVPPSAGSRRLRSVLRLDLLPPVQVTVGLCLAEQEEKPIRALGARRTRVPGARPAAAKVTWVGRPQPAALSPVE